MISMGLLGGKAGYCVTRDRHILQPYLVVGAEEPVVGEWVPLGLLAGAQLEVEARQALLLVPDLLHLLHAATLT